jgi:hypothetical protein
MKKPKNSIDLVKSFHLCVNYLYHHVADCLKRKPAFFNIHIFELDSNINNEVIFMLYYLLKSRDKATKLNVHIHASFYNGPLLLVAMADAIFPRPYSWCYLENPIRLGRHLYDDMDRDEESNRFNAPKVPSAFITDHLSLCELLNQYLPVEEIADRRMMLTDLKDYLIPTKEFEALTENAISQNL